MPGCDELGGPVVLGKESCSKGIPAILLPLDQAVRLQKCPDWGELLNFIEKDSFFYARSTYFFMLDTEAYIF